MKTLPVGLGLHDVVENIVLSHYSRETNIHYAPTHCYERRIKTFILHNYPGVDPNTLKVRVAKYAGICPPLLVPLSSQKRIDRKFKLALQLKI